MDRQEKTIRMGAAVIAAALAMRLLFGGVLQPVTAWLLQPNTQAFLIYLETGRLVRFSPSLEEFTNSAGESAIPVLPAGLQTIPTEQPVFSQEDTDLVEIYNPIGKALDLPTMLTAPLQWDLTGSEPTVLILHTHATESYTRHGEDYVESSAYRTLDEGYNMVSVGEKLAEELEKYGIYSVHDRLLHDYPSYNGSYEDARTTTQHYLRQYPTIQLVLDLHRDAAGDEGNQYRTQAEVNGVPSAQLMLVMGTNASGLSHPNWEENLALGVKLHAQLERLAPGITRPLVIRSQRFNQDLSPGALLIEVGAAGNSREEALTAVCVLAQAIAELSRGANGE